MGFAQNPIKAVIICNSKVLLHKSPTLSSTIVAYLLPGEIVRIIDTTSKRFQIGTAELFCKDFPFVKVLKQDSIIGWASGQFTFKLLSKSNEKYKSLIKSRNTFLLENHIFEIYLGRNYGIPTSYQGEITGCEEYYPVILFDQTDGKYNLVEMKNNPNSNYPYWNLTDDEGTGENIVGITSSGNNVTFNII